MKMSILGIGCGICGVGLILGLIFDQSLEIATTWLVGILILGFMGLASKD